jgi:hypothetical protein
MVPRREFAWNNVRSTHYVVIIYYIRYLLVLYTYRQTIPLPIIATILPPRTTHEFLIMRFIMAGVRKAAAAAATVKTIEPPK